MIDKLLILLGFALLAALPLLVSRRTDVHPEQRELERALQDRRAHDAAQATLRTYVLLLVMLPFVLALVVLSA